MEESREAVLASQRREVVLREDVIANDHPGDGGLGDRQRRSVRDEHHLVEQNGHERDESFGKDLG